MIRSLIIFIAILFVIHGCTNSTDDLTEQTQKEIEETIDSLVQENNIPGLNFSIVFKDGRQQNYSSGFADIKTKIPLNEHHVLFSGSTGKTYTVAVLMQMVDEGKISLKDRIIDYFPEIDWLKQVPNINDITIEMCLRHTTGLPRYAFKQGVWDTLAANPDMIWTYKDRLSFVFGDEPVHEAGKGWAYSDTNYILLGMLIEKISGKYYYDVVRDRLLKPQQLNATHAADKREIPNLPVGYSHLPASFNLPEEVVVNGRFVFNPQMEWTGGGFATATHDLARWAQLYYAGHLFSDSLASKIITPNQWSLLAENTEPYGMGSFIFPTRHGKAYGHTGFFPGFLSVFAFYPESNVSVALQMNCDYGTEKMNLIAYLDRILTVVKDD